MTGDKKMLSISDRRDQTPHQSAGAGAATQVSLAARHSPAAGGVQVGICCHQTNILSTQAE